MQLYTGGFRIEDEQSCLPVNLLNFVIKCNLLICVQYPTDQLSFAMLQGTARKNLPSLQSYPMLLGYVLLQSRAIFPHKEHYVCYIILLLNRFSPFALILMMFSLCHVSSPSILCSFFQISSYFTIVQLLTSSQFQLVFFMLLASH